MEPYIGEIRMFAGNYAPRGWAFCNGQLLSTNDHQSLFSIIGLTYGGNGVTDFKLPDLRGRAPMGFGRGIGLTNREQGQMVGTETQQLTEAHLPSHTHSVNAIEEAGTVADPENHLLANTSGFDTEYSPLEDKTKVTMNSEMVNTTGGNQQFGIVQPSIVINYIIALEGLYPPRH